MGETPLNASDIKYDATRELIGDHVITGDLRQCHLTCTGALRIVGNVSDHAHINAQGPLTVTGNVSSYGDLKAASIRTGGVGFQTKIVSTEGDIAIRNAEHEVTLDSAAKIHFKSAGKRLTAVAAGAITFDKEVGFHARIKGASINGGRFHTKLLSPDIEETAGGKVGGASTLISTKGDIFVGNMGDQVTCTSADNLHFEQAGDLCHATAKDELSFWQVGCVSTLTGANVFGGHVKNSSVLTATKGELHAHDVHNDVVLRSKGDMRIDDWRADSKRGHNITIECKGAFSSAKPLNMDETFIPMPPKKTNRTAEKIWHKFVHGKHATLPPKQDIFLNKDGYWAPVAFLEDRGFCVLLRKMISNGVTPKLGVVEMENNEPVRAIRFEGYSPYQDAVGQRRNPVDAEPDVHQR